MLINSRKLRVLVREQQYTQKALAEEAGLTRPALYAILQKDMAEVRERTLSGLVRALRLPDATPLLPDELTGYKRSVIEEHEFLDFGGLGLPATEPRALTDLFIPLRGELKVAGRKHGNSCDSTLSGRPDRTDEPRPPTKAAGESQILECLARCPRILCCGDPGSGKTTSLRHLARSYAAETQKQDGYPDAPRVPLFVRLADYARARERDSRLSLVRYVLARALPEVASESAAALEAALAKNLQSGLCLVLLDGLDEVADAGLPAVLRQFVAEYPENQFVLTSRAVGLDANPWRCLEFATFHIAPWREEEVSDFIRRWYDSPRERGRSRKKKEDERRVEELTRTILGHPPLREIATNPLMLTILVALHHANAALPRRRADLYAKVVEVLLETWEAAKRAARPGDPLHGVVLEAREFGWALSRLALEMQRQDRVLSPRWWVTELLQGFCRDALAMEGDDAKEQADRLIGHLCERSGLLVERGPDQFGFSHRTFQEYFAARGIVEEASAGRGHAIGLLNPYLYHPNWQEVVRLVAAQLTPEAASQLIRTLLDDPDPTGRLLGRGLLLSLRCLADGTLVADRRLLDQIFGCGSDLAGSKWLGVTLAVIDALHNLKTTRYAELAARMLRDMDAAARQALAVDDALVIHEAIQKSPCFPKTLDGPPGAITPRRFEKHSFRLVSLAPRLRLSDPQEWFSEVFRLLREPMTEPAVKLLFVEGPLVCEASSNEQARRALEERLECDESAAVRASSAWALGRAAASRPRIVDLLQEKLKNDESDDVRGECAAALKKVVAKHVNIRQQLQTLLESTAPVPVRVGAARGLTRVASTDGPVRESLRAHASSLQEPARVRAACLHALEGLLGEDDEAATPFHEGIKDDAPDLVRHVASQALAEALTDGRLPWSPPMVARLDAVLLGLPTPCIHTWQALWGLLGAKEVRGSMRSERILAQSLAPFAERIVLAFVFGSVARREQTKESDVDLLLVGDVRLKELSRSLSLAEETLGRVINPALYSQASFTEKYQAGDPFLLEIVRNEKVFLKGDSDELRKMVAER